jgi:hypothetical protein
MKVGTLTFHHVNNYGAALQAYALQQTILRYGYQSEIIDYKRQNISDVFQWWKNKTHSFLKGKPDRDLYTISEFLKMVFVGEGNTRDIAEPFNKFRSERLILSEPVNKNNVKNLNDRYDLFITGSDQVWNCGRVNMDSSYMLDFVNDYTKKGSYAASFGISEIPGKYREIYERLLSDYKYLSVREPAGAVIIQNLINRNAQVVLDPTLLLTIEEWKEIASRSIEEQPYILVYQLEYSETIMKFARNLAKATGCKVRLMRKPKGKNVSEEYCTKAGPEEWLSQFLGAKYIVTNSFHGAAFSINFNKNFFVEIPSNRIRGAMSSRLENLLSVFDMQHRFLVSGENEHMLEEIDYKPVNIRLEQLRTDSLNYLKTMLQNAGG